MSSASLKDPPPPPPLAAVASLANPGGVNNYLVFYNDSTTSQLLALTQAYSSLDKSGVLEEKQHEFGVGDGLQFGPQDVPSGNIVNTSALSAVQHAGTLNVFGVLKGNTTGTLLVCRLSPGFRLLNVGTPPLSSGLSFAACSDGANSGTLFFLGFKTPTDVKLYSLPLPGIGVSPSQVALSLGFNSTSYLGATYGTLPKTPAKAYAVVQDSDGALHLCSGDANIQKLVNGAKKALMGTPIACLFLGPRLVVYWFDPVGSGSSTDGSPLMRAVLENPGGDFNVTTINDAPTPNGYTQLTAFINPSSLSVGGASGTALVTYVQNSSNDLHTYTDSLQFSEK